jgi:O-antigen/teichoic acid export membrane protein
MLNFFRKTFLSNILAKHSLTLFFGVIVASVLNYFFHLLIGRWVSVESYGEIESLNSMINIVVVPAMAISMAATGYSAGFKSENDRAKNLALVRLLNRKLLIIILPVFVLFLIFMPWITRFLNFNSFWPLLILGAYLVISLFSAINVGTLIGWGNFKSIRDLNVWGSAAKFLSGILLVKIGFSVMGAIAGYFLGALFAYLLSFKMLKFIFKEKSASTNLNFDFSTVKSRIFLLFWGNLALNILGNADMVLAKHNLDPSLAGQYGVLTIVSKIIFFVTSIVATVLFSVSSENNHKKEDSFRYFLDAFLLVAVISVVSALAYFLFPGLILGILFGAKYSSLAGYLGWFGMLAGLFSLVNLTFQYLLSLRSSRAVYVFMSISLVFPFLVLFLGENIYDILLVMILTQISALLAGFYFVAKERNKFQKAEVALGLN